MRDKILLWISEKITGLLSPERKEQYRKESLKALLRSMYSENAFPYILDREVAATIFNVKHEDNLKEILGHSNISPNELLTTFYSLATKGDPSYMRDPFYRYLSKIKDIEIRKLHYRFKRNQ